MPWPGLARSPATASDVPSLDDELCSLQKRRRAEWGTPERVPVTHPTCLLVALGIPADARGEIPRDVMPSSKPSPGRPTDHELVTSRVIPHPCSVPQTRTDTPPPDVEAHRFGEPIHGRSAGLRGRGGHPPHARIQQSPLRRPPAGWAPRCEPTAIPGSRPADGVTSPNPRPKSASRELFVSVFAASLIPMKAARMASGAEIRPPPRRAPLSITASRPDSEGIRWPAIEAGVAPALRGGSPSPYTA
jgi:hypothetical protein